jgi:hypothetical protein
MKRLTIAFTHDGQNRTPVVHYDASKRPCGGGRTTWLSALKGFALKLNPTIDDILRQPFNEMEAIKDALDQQFDYLNYPLAYKFFKDQVIIVLKIRHMWLKNKI